MPSNDGPDAHHNLRHCRPGSIQLGRDHRHQRKVALSHTFDEEDPIMQSKYALVSGAIFGVVAVIQAIRAFNQWPVQ
jgi:hypothetical protein